MAVAALSGYLAEGLRRTGEQLEEASTQLADLQAFSQHVIDSLTSGLATCDMEGRMLTFNRAAEAITGSDQPRMRSVSRSRDVLQLPTSVPDCSTSGRRAGRSPRIEYGYTRGRRTPDRAGDQRAPLVTPRGDARIPVHLPGRHRVEEAGARGARAAAARRSRRDGRRHRSRDSQPARVDGRVDPDPSRRAAADAPSSRS